METGAPDWLPLPGCSEFITLTSAALDLRYCSVMDERYSLSDRQMYGAEDDFEMDMILDAIDRALEAPKPPISAQPDNCTKAPHRTQAAARETLRQLRDAKPSDPSSA